MGRLDAARRARRRHRARARSGRSSRARRSSRPACSRGRRPPSTSCPAAGSCSALGAGWNETEFRAFGLPFDHRVARFAEAFEIVRRLLAGERVTFDGRYHAVADAVLLPPPARRPPLMVGATGPRMLATTLPHVDAWNTWYDRYGNTPEGFAARTAGRRPRGRPGRDPAEIERSACVLVVLDRAAGERPARGIAPLEGSPSGSPAACAALAEAGADEAILVVDPITERSIRALGEAL